MTGWYNYGYRDYDPMVMRITTVDPIRSRSNWYAYVDGDPVNYVHLWGLAAGDLFATPDDAARDFGITYNDDSIRNWVEYATSIYETTDCSGVTNYSYNKPKAGNHKSVAVPRMPWVDERVATAHTHAEYDVNYLNEQFSTADMNNARKRNVPNYVATPAGSLQRYYPVTGGVTTIATDMPSDPSDPHRLNAVDPTINPVEDPTRTLMDDFLDLMSNFGTIAPMIMQSQENARSQTETASYDQGLKNE